MNEVARCGELWFLCGPVFNMASPMYWIGTVGGSVIWFWVGYRFGRHVAKVSQ